MHRGWALMQQGQAGEGLEQMHQGLTAYCATGAGVGRSYFPALLAKAYGTIGQFDSVWRGNHYHTKQVEAYAVQESGYWLVITVITRYF
jgi:hypothetical protein